MAFDLSVPSVAILGGGRFPVRRIYCVGQNYRAHALEMGGDPDRQPPFFFAKPADAVTPDGSAIAYPPMTQDYHHEIELVVAIGAEGREVPVEHASALIFGYAVGLDMTRRDLQATAKKVGRPWDMAKGFDQSAPCGAITPKTQVGEITSGAIRLTVNSETRQTSDLDQMIWSVNEVITELSRYATLAPGDLIYTGTPEGVGPVRPGDVLHAQIAGLADLRVSIEEPLSRP